MHFGVCEGSSPQHLPGLIACKFTKVYMVWTQKAHRLARSGVLGSGPHAIELFQLRAVPHSARLNEDIMKKKLSQFHVDMLADAERQQAGMSSTWQ